MTIFILYNCAKILKTFIYYKVINKLFREYNRLWRISHKNLDNLNKKIYKNTSLKICVCNDNWQWILQKYNEIKFYIVHTISIFFFFYFQSIIKSLLISLNMLFAWYNVSLNLEAFRGNEFFPIGVLFFIIFNNLSEFPSFYKWKVILFVPYFNLFNSDEPQIIISPNFTIIIDIFACDRIKCNPCHTFNPLH